MTDEERSEERADAVHELTGIEVDEVSLVDRPATGRRFVLFKRGGLLRRAGRERLAAGESENICSGLPDEAALTDLRKRAQDLQDEMARLRETAAGLEERLVALEGARPVRQSGDAAPRRESLWAGVL